jgi:hypothetical protein
VAEIPVRPKRGAEIPVEPRRRRSVWPWVLGLLALVLLPFLFLRDRDRDDTAGLSDTAAVTDTTGRFGGRTTGTAAGTIARDTGAAARATAGTPGDTTPRLDTTTRGDTARRADTARRP